MKQEKRTWALKSEKPNFGTIPYWLCAQEHIPNLTRFPFPPLSIIRDATTHLQEQGADKKEQHLRAPGIQHILSKVEPQPCSYMLDATLRAKESINT